MLQIAVFSASWLLLLAAGRQLIPPSLDEAPVASSQDERAWLGMGLPLAISGAFSVFLKRGDLLALGTVATSAQIAPYAAAVRIAGLTIFGLSAANASTAPLMREYWSVGDRQSLQACVDRSAAIATLFSLPLVLCFLVFPRLFLGAFGPEYLAGTAPLRLLAIGQLVNAMTGPVGPVMVAAGLQRRYLAMTALSTVGMIALLALLVRSWGMVGAALGALLSVALLNLLLAWTVRHKTGLRTVVSPRAIRLVLGDIARGANSIVRLAHKRRRGDA
jgi:O-antigen/teichoic acid export membrane protein